MSFKTISTFIQFILIFLFSNIIIINAYKNNVCTDLGSYLFADYSKNCYYLKDVKYGMNDRIIFHTRKSENHKVVTSDGYILDVYRMRPSNSKGVILLQHPLTVDSTCWMMQGNESTALYFFDNGYDVWMPNFRGTESSMAHVNLTIKDRKYWDFTFHEMGVYDLKASVDYITKKTGQQVVYIGHSLSTTIGLVYASLHPQEAKEKIKVMISLATVAYMTNMTTKVVKFAPIEPIGRALLPFVETVTSLRYANSKMKIARTGYALLNWFPFKTSYGYYETLGGGGHNNSEFDPKLANMFFTTLSSTSIKLYQHFAHTLNYDKRFRMYDYGKKKNLQIYNQAVAPEYPVWNIVTPMLFFSSDNDIFSDRTDLDILFSLLTPEAKKYGEIMTVLNHFDYQVGRDRIELVYDPIVKFLDKLYM